MTAPRSARRGCFELTLSFTILLFLAGSTLAADPVFYSAGKAYPLIRSATEFAVELEEGQSMATMGTHAWNQAGGVLKPVPWGHRNGRFAILEVADASIAARHAARAIPAVKAVHPVYRFRADGLPVLSSGELVAKLRTGLSASERDDLFASYGVEVAYAMEDMDEVYVLRPVDPDGDEVAIAAAMYADPGTIYCHPNFRAPMQLRQSIPQDTFFNRQWHLNSTGQEGATPGADIGALEAWSISLGQDVLVGQFDDSCDVHHEDLLPNYSNQSHNPATAEVSSDAANPQDIDDRHGTAVMGLSVGAPNSLGVRGSAPLARFTASRGLNEFITNAQTASVYTYARQAGVDVHNNSWGFIGVPNPDIVVDAILTAFVEGRDGKGMVVVFASGNNGEEVFEGFELSTLPTVIGIGASNARDLRASYSNYGEGIDLLAPSGDDFLPGLVTTDNTDDSDFVEPGYNNGGFDDLGFPDLPNPDYTQGFSGTSGACPVATGVAALLVSVNPDLTATQVRITLEHTADRISPSDAGYKVVTQRSLRYGYGRINAAAAVAAADNGKSWPDRVADVSVVGGDTLRWQKNDDLRGENDEFGDRTAAVLVVQKQGDAFNWVPTDGESYTLAQEVAEGVTVVLNADTEAYTFDDSSGILYFAIFARNAAGNYSWGVAVDSEGNVTDGGTIPGEGGGGGGDGDGILIPPGADIPKISISATPLSGFSPLEVEFRANAQTDDSGLASTLWDFGDGASDTRRTTTHTYTVGTGESESFKATFTAEDGEGDVGMRSILINVTSPFATNDNDNGNGGVGGAPRIILQDPRTGDVLPETGTAPYTVQFSADLSSVAGTFAGITWFFGDASSPVDSLTTTHTYTSAGTYAASVEVRTTVAGGVTTSATANKVITVLPGSSDANGNDNGNFNGGGTTGGTGTGVPGCGVGMLLPFVGLLMMTLLRRR